MSQPSSARPHPLRVWRARQAPPLSQDDFAALIGCTIASISRIETGLQNPSLPLIRKIVEVTNGEVSAASLVMAAGHPYPPDSEPIRERRQSDDTDCTVSEA